MPGNPVEDAYNKGKSSMAAEEGVGLSNDIIKPKPAPAKPAVKPKPLPNPDGELNWVQRMAKQVHDYFVRQKSAKKAPADPNTLNNTSSRY
jgi:hypothetical protein